MTHGSLFSGIGGVDLGFERAGISTHWQVELDDYCTRVLEKHWPSIPRHKDIKEVGKHNLTPVDVISGGFPCQDISVAGRGAGIDGERSGLWSEMLRIVGELRPRWVFVENVTALRTRGADRVLSDLEAEGYTGWPFVVGAWAVGAQQNRDRVWIVAHSSGERVERLRPERVEVSHPLAEPLLPLRDRDGQWQVEPDLRRVPDGVPCWMDRLRCIGNSVVPQIAEAFGKLIVALDATKETEGK